jgi:hypothetical protein
LCGCYLWPLISLVIPTSVWSFLFYLICSVRPAESSFPRIHRSQDNRESHILSSREGKGQTTFKREKGNKSKNH